MRVVRATGTNKLRREDFWEEIRIAGGGGGRRRGLGCAALEAIRGGFVVEVAADPDGEVDGTLWVGDAGVCHGCVGIGGLGEAKCEGR